MPTRKRMGKGMVNKKMLGQTDEEGEGEGEGEEDAKGANEQDEKIQ